MEKIKILIVDDEENVLKALKRLCIDEDFEVITASSGKEGLNILKEGEFAVIISDERMPEMRGTTFLQHAKELCPDAVRILLTGYADITASINAINKAGVYRYITKPWNDEEVISIFKNAIDRYRLVTENKHLLALTEKQKEELHAWSKELEYYVQVHTIDLTNKDRELNALRDRLQKNLDSFMIVLLRLIELRDKTILTHSQNVAFISGEMAKKIQLTTPEIEILTIAGQLHDVGKIGLSDIILVKHVEELSPHEMSEYINHPAAGQVVVSMIEDIHKAGPLVRHHHERFDGNGFPDRLSGEKIPLGSRIIAIADQFERLTRQRTVEDSLKKIRSRTGSEFDPDLCNVLENVAYEQYSTLFSSDDIVETELSIKDLVPGLIVSRDVIVGSELIVIKKDSVLTHKNIDLLKRWFHTASPMNGVFVYKKRKPP